MVLRIKAEINNYINELGTEGRLISMQLEELVANIDQEAKLLIRDYIKDPDEGKSRKSSILEAARADDELLEGQNMVRFLGYPNIEHGDG